MRETHEELDILDPDTSESGMSVCLYVEEDEWQVCQESDLYDEDGVWASVWMPYDADEDKCEELAEQLLEEIEDEFF